jgi:hypothetical protein
MGLPLSAETALEKKMRAMRCLVSGLCLLAGCISPASACILITSNKPFKPSPEIFLWDKATLNRALAAPKLKTARIDRLADIPTDYRQRMEACRYGMASVWIRLPRDGKAELDKTGFQFKLLTKDSGLAVDDVPVTGVREGDSMRFDFLLFESPYATKQALVVKIEVYAVNARRQRGPASTLVLRAPVARSIGK